MLNEFYDFIAKKINSFFQTAAADGTLLKGESFCLKLDNEEMVTEVANALEELATSNQSKGEYVFPCGDGTLYKTYTLIYRIVRRGKFDYSAGECFITWNN